MSRQKKPDSPPPAGEVLDLAKLREPATRARQDRGAAALAQRFHEAMGWQGKAPAGKPRKPRNKKKR